MSGKITMSSCFGADRFVVEFDPDESPYRGLYPSVMSLEFFPYYSTIDDPVIIDIAEQLRSQMRYNDDFYISSALLAFVQQNIRYVSDDSRFGKDLWELPIYTITERQADCDGMADLYTSLAYNIGIDVITIAVTGHMCSAVNVVGSHGKAYVFDGKKYYHMETTDGLPAVGRFWGSAETIYMARPEIPSEAFKKTLTENIRSTL